MCEYCEGCEYLKWWIDPGYDGEPTNTQYMCMYWYDGRLRDDCPKCGRDLRGEVRD